MVVNFSTLLLSDGKFISSQPAALRITVLRKPGNNLADSIAANIVLKRRGKKVGNLFSGQGQGGVLSTNIKMPPGLEGKFTLVVKLVVDDRHEVCHVPIVIKKNDSNAVGFKLGLRKPAKEDETTLQGSHQLELVPENGVLVANMKNTLYLRASLKANGAPISMQGSFQMVEGRVKEALPSDLSIEENGLKRLRIYPLRNLLAFELQVVDGAGQKTEGRLAIKTRPLPIRLRTTHSLLRPSQGVRLLVQSFLLRGRLYLDIYQAGRWIGAEDTTISRGQASMVLSLAGLKPGLIRIHAYTLAPMPYGAVDTRWLFLSRSGIAPLLERFKLAGIEQPYLSALGQISRPDRLAGFLLSRLSSGFNNPPVLKDCGAQRFKETFSLKKRLQGVLLALLGILFGLIFLLSAIWIGRNYLVLHREGKVLLLDDDEEVIHQMSRIRSLWQVLALLGIIAGGLLGIIWMLLVLKF